MNGVSSLTPQQPLSPSLRSRNNAASAAAKNRIAGHLDPYGGQANATAGQNASPLKAAVSGNATTPAAPYKSRLSGIMGGYQSPLSGAARGLQSPLAGALHGYQSSLSGAANQPVPQTAAALPGILPAAAGAVGSLSGAASGLKHPYSGAASGYQSPLSGAARGATSPLSGAASGVQAPFAGAASNYHSPLSGIARVPNPDFQPQSLPHLQAQEARRTQPFGMPRSPLQGALGNVGPMNVPAPAVAPVPDQPVSVPTAGLGSSFPTGGQLKSQIGNAIVPPRPAPTSPPMFVPGEEAAGSVLANAMMSPPAVAQPAPPQARREARSMGQLADLIASTDYFGAANADGLAAARAMGEQQFLNSPQGQRRAAAIADVTRTYNPDFGPGAAMRDRESALAAAAQPAGPTWADRQASSQAGMLGLLSQALAGQGDLPPASVQEGLSQLAPGTTLRGTSELGTPIVISRGNAQQASPEQRQAQSAYLADRRGARLGRLREAVLGNAMRRQAGIAQQQQAMLAQAQQQQLQQMFARDPQATTQLMAAMGQNQLLGHQIAGDQNIAQQQLLADVANNQVNVGLRRRAMRQEHELAKQRLVSEQGLTSAQAEQALAAAERSRAETGVIRDAGSPEGQIRSALLGSLGESMPEVLSGDIDIQDRLRGAVGNALREVLPQDQPADESRPELGAMQAAEQAARLTPMMRAAFGDEFAGWSPQEILGEVASRVGTPAEMPQADLDRVSAYIRARSVDPAFNQRPGFIQRLLNTPSLAVDQAIQDAQRGTLAADRFRERLAKERQQREAERMRGLSRSESHPVNSMDTGRYLGMP